MAGKTAGRILKALDQLRNTENTGVLVVMAILVSLFIIAVSLWVGEAIIEERVPIRGLAQIELQSEIEVKTQPGTKELNGEHRKIVLVRSIDKLWGKVEAIL